MSDERTKDAPVPTVALGHDGKIDGIYRGRDSRRSWTSDDNARLELAAQPKRKDADPEPPQRAARATAKPTVAITIVIGVLALPFVVVFGSRAVEQWRHPKAKASGLIMIDSHPPNAQLFLDGKEVGRTPYVVPNTFQPGTEVQIRITYPGAQDWTGTLPGGVDTSVTADLEAATGN